MKYLPASSTWLFTLLIILWALMGCSDSSTTTTTGPDSSDNNNNNDGYSWIIPENKIVSGGPGKDGIPSIDNPKFSVASEVDFIPEKRRVVGIKMGSTVRAYPHQILDWHEIVNDRVGGRDVAITYCPLTGTAIGWDREVNGSVTEFGVSGLLFHNNLIPYDRNTDSRWSQMQLRSVAGDLSGTDIETVDLIETTWNTWKQMYPQSDVLTKDTGFNRIYQSYAYGSNYSTDDSNILFPVDNSDDRLPNKDRVHGVISTQPADLALVQVYPIADFGQEVRVIHDQIAGKNIVVVGSSQYDISASFETVLEDGTQLNFQAVQGSLPVVMQDQQGNKWDVFGYAVEGPRRGERLTPTLSYTGYWFAWADFFPTLRIVPDN